MKEFSEFEKKIGITFNKQSILKQAFTHRSYLNENKKLKIEHNERLEFLGDAVLELVTTDYLYNKYPEKPEGEMTALRSALVNALTLSGVATTIGVNDYLLLSKGEAKDVGRARQYILANTLEAIIGALYVDQGYDKAAVFVTQFILPLADGIVEGGNWIDAKSKFQEKSQERLSITPLYKTLKEVGPDHDRHFTVGVYLGNDLYGQGTGKSKQDAEQEAAANALALKGWE